METQTAPARNWFKPSILILLVVLLLASLALVGIYLIKNANKEPKEKVLTGLTRDKITIGSSVIVLGVFPESAAETRDIDFNNNIFDGLTRVINGEVKGALATSWTNPDKTTWRFTLRKGVKFHNGDPFTAADLKFSIDQAIAKEWPDTSYLITIKSVEIVDNFTVDIKTASPDPVLLARLANVPIVSEKQYKSKKADEQAVGTGPYKFVSLDDKEGVLEANESWYLGTPKVKKVVYKFYPVDTTDEQMAQALRRDEVDLIVLQEEKVVNSLKNDFQVKSSTGLEIRILWLDAAREKSPYVDKVPNPLKNKLVRQAIYKAIDTNEIIKEQGISTEPPSQLVTEGVFGYNPNIKRPKKSLEEARNLMEQAGMTGGFSMTLDTPEGVVKTANAIAKNLKEININVKVNPITKDTGFGKVTSGDSSAFMLSYTADILDSGDVFADLLHTPTSNFGSSNFFSYSNSEIDKLAEEASSIFEPKKRLPKLQEAMVKAMEELPLIPLFQQKTFWVIRNNFDWTPTALGVISSNEISGREVTTK
ncbi:MAG: hypothetical protein A2172_00945 [Candidatus Woykebacteria bacterium RBG_13_40_15]|uniref:Solute-binding protein family 5 domain-containing protein n=1 Tax=Candidatus Woykebacteria bacterium RBG_13_40_15 TaxID=1802593 RepID=A0A1G1W8U9_9BACT|nr:MAG: hypothetical protein A2172_00945 [Candidatus Woykebacteria bacterium RBG_13_40_15]